MTKNTYYFILFHLFIFTQNTFLIMATLYHLIAYKIPFLTVYFVFKTSLAICHIIQGYFQQVPIDLGFHFKNVTQVQYHTIKHLIKRQVQGPGRFFPRTSLSQQLLDASSLKLTITFRINIIIAHRYRSFFENKHPSFIRLA